jgi:hypothetical protein
MFFFLLARFLVCLQSAPCREVSMCLPATEWCTYSTFVHSNEQGKYGEIEHVTSIIFKTII